MPSDLFNQLAELLASDEPIFKNRVIEVDFKKEREMKTGDSIYYYSKEGDTFPGIVIDIKTKVKIKINHFKADKILWVSRSNLTLQDN